jgi:ribosome recycling factor
MSTADLNELKRRMNVGIDVLRKELGGLRTGRASASMLDPVMVEAYGQHMPLSQVATVSVPEARMLTVQVWDKGQVKFVEKAIREAGLGLNPQVDGALIRLPIPELNAERRAELAKVAGKYTEAARIAVRNVRREGMDAAKKMEKDGDFSQDAAKQRADEIQKLTDAMIKQIDELLAQKEKEIKQV